MEAENKNAEEILETDKQRKETSSIVFQEVTVESDDTRKRIVEDAPIASIPAHTEDKTVDKSFNEVNLDGTALDICGENSSHPAEHNPTREPFINEEELVMGKIGNKITEEENISEQAIEDVPQELTQGNAIQRSQDDNMEAANSWTEDRKAQIIEAGHFNFSCTSRRHRRSRYKIGLNKLICKFVRHFLSPLSSLIFLWQSSLSGIGLDAEEVINVKALLLKSTG
ncbi:hypothetical protein Nepgr_020771 [Nepenthes gracilis]|uniref:Uncharacterized protein n=1 Tax=Nepenthes gracilis TaxID=150966 RepID=A0AAD3XWK5_NEPGR|nr:hypothetical protein Nepgr_020771 [Nepenthes gracilis]